MATSPQRALSIITAALNTAPTQSQQDRITKAFAATLPPDATTVQIADQFIKEVRQFLLSRVTDYEIAAGTTALREGKLTQVPIDFPETP